MFQVEECLCLMVTIEPKLFNQNLAPKWKKSSLWTLLRWVHTLLLHVMGKPQFPLLTKLLHGNRYLNHLYYITILSHKCKRNINCKDVQKLNKWKQKWTTNYKHLRGENRKENTFSVVLNPFHCCKSGMNQNTSTCTCKVGSVTMYSLKKFSIALL